MAGHYRYRKVAVRTWDDEWFTGLSPIPPCGAGLWIYLLTGRETCSIPGLLRVGEAGLAEALGWPLEAFREAFREVSRDGHVVADWRRRIVWVPNALSYNSPESPNVVRGWRLPWSELPDCPLKSKIFRELKTYVEGLNKAFAEAFAEALGQPSPNQEQEQEQEQDDAGAAADAPAPLLLDLDGGMAEPPEELTPSLGTFSERQREALDALREIPFHVVRWKRPEGTVAEVIGRVKAHDLARDLGGDGFPRVPVRQTIAQAGSWTRANPAKAKTPGGLRRFLVDWFAREQNRGGARPDAPAPPATRRGGDLLAKVNRAAKEGQG